MKKNEDKKIEKKLKEYSDNIKKELIKEIKEKIDLDIALLQYDNDIISYVEKEIDELYFYEYLPEFNSFLINIVDHNIEQDRSYKLSISNHPLGIELFFKRFIELNRIRLEIVIKLYEEIDKERKIESQLKNKQIKKNNYINKFGVSYKNKYINNKKRLKK